MGVPFMVCMRCGCGLPQPVVERTWTQKEMNETQKPRRKPKPWKEELLEIVEKIWEDKYGNKK